MTGQVVIVDGQRVLIPGVYPEISPASLAQIVGPGERVPLVVGPSDGGLPGKVYAFSSYPEAASVLRGGRALSYISRVFNPSPDVAGARRVLFIRSNGDAAQAGVSLSAPPAAQNFDAYITSAEIIGTRGLFRVDTGFYVMQQNEWGGLSTAFDINVDKLGAFAGNVDVLVPTFGFTDSYWGGVYINSPTSAAIHSAGLFIDDVMILDPADPALWLLNVPPLLEVAIWTDQPDGLLAALGSGFQFMAREAGSASAPTPFFARRVGVNMHNPLGQGHYVDAVAAEVVAPNPTNIVWTLNVLGDGVQSFDAGQDSPQEWFVVSGPLNQPSFKFSANMFPGSFSTGFSVAEIGVTFDVDGVSLAFTGTLNIVYA